MAGTPNNPSASSAGSAPRKYATPRKPKSKGNMTNEDSDMEDNQYDGGSAQRPLIGGKSVAGYTPSEGFTASGGGPKRAAKPKQILDAFDDENMPDSPDTPEYDDDDGDFHIKEEFPSGGRGSGQLKKRRVQPKKLTTKMALDYAETQMSLADAARKPPESASNGRHVGRQLVKWNYHVDQLLLLIVQYECAYQGITLPWNSIARRLFIEKNTTGPCILQHLAKLRIALLERGAWVPPLAGKRQPGTGPDIRGVVKVAPDMDESRFVTWFEDASMLITPADIDAHNFRGKQKGLKVVPPVLYKEDSDADDESDPGLGSSRNSRQARMDRASGGRPAKRGRRRSDGYDDNTEEEYNPSSAKKARSAQKLSHRIKNEFVHDDDEGDYIHSSAMMAFEADEETHEVRKIVVMKLDPSFLQNYSPGIIGPGTDEYDEKDIAVAPGAYEYDSEEDRRRRRAHAKKASRGRKQLAYSNDDSGNSDEEFEKLNKGVERALYKSPTGPSVGVNYNLDGQYAGASLGVFQATPQNADDLEDPFVDGNGNYMNTNGSLNNNMVNEMMQNPMVRDALQATLMQIMTSHNVNGGSRNVTETPSKMVANAIQNLDIGNVNQGTSSGPGVQNNNATYEDGSGSAGVLFGNISSNGLGGMMEDDMMLVDMTSSAHPYPGSFDDAMYTDGAMNSFGDGGLYAYGGSGIGGNADDAMLDAMNQQWNFQQPIAGPSGSGEHQMLDMKAAQPMEGSFNDQGQIFTGGRWMSSDDLLEH